MFIQNKHGEIVNTDHVLAIKVFDDRAPYQIHAFTEKTETIFEFDSRNEVILGLRKIEGFLFRVCFRWAECKNWKFRSDKIMSINDIACWGLKISMTARDFNVHFADTRDSDANDAALEAAKKKLAETLSEKFMPNSPDSFERIG